VSAPRITRQLLREWEACWSYDAIAAVVPPEGVTVWDVLDAPAELLDHDERVWVLAHVLPEREARLFACRCAARALRAAGVTDIRSWRAVWKAAQYAHGLATAEELAVADWAAADDTACDAAYAAVIATAYTAGFAAAADVACDVACDAARAAVIATAYTAGFAAAAEQRRQLDDLRATCSRVWGLP